jgi:hypothetical protein
MEDIDNSSVSINLNDPMDFKEFFNILMSGKWIIFSITTFFSIIGIAYSLSLPNIYESKALLVSSKPSNQSGIVQNYAGLASIAGIDISSESPKTNAEQAIEKLNSLSFFESYFLPNIFLPDLMGFKSWDSSSNMLKYDAKLYNEKSDSWVRDFSYPQKQIPSAQESFNIFKEKHLSISVDKKTNFLTVKIKHQSPYIAKEWNKVLIDQINSFYRKKDKNEAERASDYLNSLLIKTNLSEIKQSIALLLQQETQKLTLIEASEFYVYEFIDPPVVMEKKSEPQRSLICILAAAFGAMLGILYILVRHYAFNEEFKT